MARTLQTEARKLLKLRADNDKKQKAAKKSKVKLDAQQRVVYEMMEAEGQKTVTLELGGEYGTISLGRRKKTFARVLNIDELLASLRAEGREEETIKHDVRKAPLNELVKERLETGQPMPKGLDFSDTPYIQVTKKKGG
jgi:hypothetical protein